jgi:hypothetical protein
MSSMATASPAVRAINRGKLAWANSCMGHTFATSSCFIMQSHCCCACRIHDAWQSGTCSLGAPGQPGRHSPAASWLQPLRKLDLVMLAKVQWDARQCPAIPSKSRALTQLCSPCVAGEFLKQRAPGLVPHVRPSTRTAEAAPTQATDMMRGVAPGIISLNLIKLRDYYVAAAAHGSKLADLGEIAQQWSGCLCRAMHCMVLQLPRMSLHWPGQLLHSGSSPMQHEVDCEVVLTDLHDWHKHCPSLSTYSGHQQWSFRHQPTCGWRPRQCWRPPRRLGR